MVRVKVLEWQKTPIILCSISAVILVILCVTLITWSSIHGLQNVIDLFKGECIVASKKTFILRTVITLVLFLVTLSSDLFLRLILAPLPDDIRKAHRKTGWLDIGVNSWNNLKHVNWWRRVFWLLILLSSVPIQFFFNSAINLSSTSTLYD